MRDVWCAGVLVRPTCLLDVASQQETCVVVCVRAARRSGLLFGEEPMKSKQQNTSKALRHATKAKRRRDVKHPLMYQKVLGLVHGSTITCVLLGAPASLSRPPSVVFSLCRAAGRASSGKGCASGIFKDHRCAVVCGLAIPNGREVCAQRLFVLLDGHSARRAAPRS